MTSSTLRRTDQNSICGDTITAYVTSLIIMEGEARLINGRPLSDSMSRALYRWTHEHANPSIWSVDNFLVAVGIHLDEFFRWATANGHEVWEYGEPQWHRRELTAADWKEINKTWRDA